MDSGRILISIVTRWELHPMQMEISSANPIFLSRIGADRALYCSSSDMKTESTKHVLVFWG